LFLAFDAKRIVFGSLCSQNKLESRVFSSRNSFLSVCFACQKNSNVFKLNFESNQTKSVAFDSVQLNRSLLQSPPIFHSIPSLKVSFSVNLVIYPSTNESSIEFNSGSIRLTSSNHRFSPVL
jgi:hypothetical protein